MTRQPERRVSVIDKVAALIPGVARERESVGTVHVVDPSPLNWLYVLYNCAEEPVRVNAAGHVEPAAMREYRWVDDRTLEIELREGNQFADGEAVTATTLKRSFDEVMRWQAPHPPGTHFNHRPGTRCEVTGDRTVRLHLPEPDGLALGKLRAMHVMSTRFWNEIGFGYARTGTGEGHW